MNKEQVYDEQIAPLMDQIIGICKTSGIAMVASFAIPTEEDPTLRCTSLLPDGEGVPCSDFQRAVALIRNGHVAQAPTAVAITITSAPKG